MAQVIQASQNTEGGSEHAVAVLGLRVLVVCDGPDEWYAHGLDIDYLAQGKDLESVKRAFEKGLEETICENLRTFGHIKKLLTPAPVEVWEEFYAKADSAANVYSAFCTHDLDVATEERVFIGSNSKPPRGKRAEPRLAQAKTSAQNTLPFSGINYITPKSAMHAAAHVGV